MHLVAVFFLYQRVPSEKNHRVGLRQESVSLDTVLARSRQKLGDRQQAPRHEEDVEHGGADDELGAAGHVDPHDKKEEADHAPDPSENWNKQEERAGQVPQTMPVKVEVSSEQGNRVTDNAYIGDFMYERVRPPFRNKELVFPKLDSKVASLQACEYISDNRLLTRCHDGNRPLIAYNTQPFPRTWCGKVIRPNSVERFDEPCHEPVRLFPMSNPPVSGEGMPPVVITSIKGSTSLEDVRCDIPCRQEVGIKGTPRFIEGMDWTITQSSIESNAFRKDEYFSTPSFMSSVPQSTFSFDIYNLSVPALAYDETLPSASYLVDSNCNSMASKRHRWVGAVTKHYPVAHYGSCDHDTDLPEGMSLSNREDRIKLHGKHRFNLAFEATNERDHITDVVWDAFQSGSLPVVLGPTNIESHFPPNSFINAGRFQYWDELGKYVKQVGENKTLWESYHEWRRDPNALQSFRQRYKFTGIDPTCRVCRWAYAKQYGIGWDHIQQVVQEPVLSRSLCVDSITSLVASPFYESYTTRKSDSSYTLATRAKGSTSCDGRDNALLGVFDSVDRFIEAHDGVTDLVFNKINRPKENGDFILRLECGVKNAIGTYFRNPHSLVSTVRGPLYSSIAIQDERSKVTVLANWETEMLGTAEGTIEIMLHGKDKGDLHQDEQRRLRVIVEDMSYLHDKMTEYFPSSFGKLMIKDFVDPLQVFYDEKQR
jgi:hypothetical protein